MAEQLIEIDGQELFKVVDALRDFPKEIRPAIASAVNKTMDSTVTQIKKEIVAEYTVKQVFLLGSKKKGIEGAIKKKRATVNNFTASAIAEGGQVALYKFQHTPTNPPKSLGWGKNSYRQPVKAMVKKGGRKKNVVYSNGEKSYKAFIVKRNGANMIFARTSDKRLPIKKLFALSVPQMISDKNDSKASIKRIKTRAEEMLIKKVDQEINYRLEKIAKGGAKK